MNRDRPPTPAEIVELVCHDLRVDLNDLRGDDRGEHTTRARRAIVVVMRITQPDHSYPDIARLLGREGSSHSTAITAGKLGAKALATAAVVERTLAHFPASEALDHRLEVARVTARLV